MVLLYCGQPIQIDWIDRWLTNTKLNWNHILSRNMDQLKGLKAFVFESGNVAKTWNGKSLLNFCNSLMKRMIK